MVLVPGGGASVTHVEGMLSLVCVETRLKAESISKGHAARSAKPTRSNGMNSVMPTDQYTELDQS